MDYETTRTYRRGDVVCAVRQLGKRAWCSGVPSGTVGTVVAVDWLGDLRVEFDLDGDWFAGRCTVVKVVASCDVVPVRVGRERLPAI